MNPGSPSGDAEMFVAEAFREAMAGGNVQALDEYFSEEMEYYRSSGRRAGRGELRDDIETFHGAFPDLGGRIQRITSRGDTVSLLYELSGTHVGEYAGLAATNQEMKAKGGIIARVDEEICECRLIFDNLGMFEQIGVLND